MLSGNIRCVAITSTDRIDSYPRSSCILAGLSIEETNIVTWA